VAGIGSHEYKEDTKRRLFEVVNAFSQTFRQECDRDGKPVLTVWPNGVQEERMYTGPDWLASLTVRQQNGTTKDTFQYFYTDSLGVYDPTGHLH
jgi:hypothetical protein